MKTLLKIFKLLTPQERTSAFILFLMILVVAILDMAGVASILPFMAVLANPEVVNTNKFLVTVYNKIGSDNFEEFLLVLGFLVFAVFILSLSFKAFTTFVQLRFVMMQEFSIGKRLVEGYLNQPYSWFLSRHSADLGKTILSEVNQVINQGIAPMISLVAQSTVVLALLTLLLFIDYKLALIVGFTLSSAYSIIFFATKNFLSRIGADRVVANQKRFTAVSEAFGGLKEIKISGLQSAYSKRFSSPAEEYARNISTAQIISQLPRYALEGIAFGGMLLVMLYLISQKGSFDGALPIITVYAFAGYRLMPALQQIYGSITQLRFAGPAIDSMYNELTSLQPLRLDSKESSIDFQHSIVLKEIEFSYPNSSRATLEIDNLTIQAKSTVAFVGATGSGKTTAVDLILGLLVAEKGRIEVDGQLISEENLTAWRKIIGYVPQHIYLADDSISANIAFGLDEKEVNQVAVERSAKIAALHDFIENELPNKYQTNVGERGVRLSGGQRQRIGIARALYHNPKILILDEATSALDNLTEDAVMEAITELGDEITIILIAHRLGTVKACDTIFLLESGKITAKGSYEELLIESKKFEAMVRSEEFE